MRNNLYISYQNKKIFLCKGDIGTEIIYETCFVNNLTHKVSPVELQVRIFTNFKFVKIRTYISSAASESNTKELLLLKICMRPWIRS